MADLLELDSVDTYYGRVQALSNVSMRIAEGEIVTLMGSNGAGKTTTLRTISGRTKPARGHVRLRGTEISGLAPDRVVMRGISHAPEGRRVFARMSVRDNLFLGAYVRNDAASIRSDQERVFRFFPRLKERRSQIAGTLSGGEQQMLAIGRALMSDPRVLLLDEPSMGLAPLMVAKIFDIVRDIARRGVTILLVEQNARLALELASRGYVMESGSITLKGEARQLLA